MMVARHGYSWSSDDESVTGPLRVHLQLSRDHHEKSLQRQLDEIHDTILFQNVVYYGFFYIVLVQFISTLLKDKSPVLDTLVSLSGFTFYLSMGSLWAKQIFDVLEADDHHFRFSA